MVVLHGADIACSLVRLGTVYTLTTAPVPCSPRHVTLRLRLVRLEPHQPACVALCVYWHLTFLRNVTVLSCLCNSVQCTTLTSQKSVLQIEFLRTLNKMCKPCKRSQIYGAISKNSWVEESLRNNLWRILKCFSDRTGHGRTRNITVSERRNIDAVGMPGNQDNSLNIDSHAVRCTQRLCRE